MEEKRVGSRRIFLCQGASGNHGAVGHFKIVAVVAAQHHAVGGVGKLDVAECFAEAEIAVVVQCVSREGISVFGHHKRALVQVGLRRLGVVHAVACVDGSVARYDGGCGVENGDVGERVVEHLICVDVERVVLAERVEMHVFTEKGVLGRRAVFSVPRIQTVFFVGEHSAHFVITQLNAEVVVEYVGGEGHVLVDQPYLLAGVGIKDGKLRGVGIVQFIAVDKQGVALFHAHISECLQSSGIVEEMSRIAVHVHVAFAEFHIAHHNLVVLPAFGA